VTLLPPNPPAAREPNLASLPAQSTEELDAMLARMEVQGALEGLAARWAAERGITASEAKPVRDCLSEIDALLQQQISFAGLMQYVRLNTLFHRSVLDLAGCATLSGYSEDEPASVFAITDVTQTMLSNPERLNRLLVIEQDQHHRILDAVESGMGARAESLVREHAQLARRHLIALA
jgi:GntR family transcriptional regulator of vanillate catabolism